MVTNTPVRNPHSSTADLLTWTDNPVADSTATGSAASAARSSARSHQPSDGISKVVFGGQITDEEVESLNKRKPVSGYKLKETTGSRIFSTSRENNMEAAGAANPNSTNKTGLRMYQQTVSGLSHISFGDEESKSPKKAVSEAKQRELNGTLGNESDTTFKKQFTSAKNKELSGTLDDETDSTFKKQFTNAKNKELNGTLDNELDTTFRKQFTNAKNKELIGNNIFGPPPEIQPRTSAARALAVKESIGVNESAPNKTSAENPMSKTTKKIPTQKHTVLSRNNIFKGGSDPALEKPVSSAKLREMSGSDIFADGKAASRDYLGGVRKPPGGESSISLV